MREEKGNNKAQKLDFSNNLLYFQVVEMTDAIVRIDPNVSYKKKELPKQKRDKEDNEKQPQPKRKKQPESAKIQPHDGRAILVDIIG